VAAGIRVRNPDIGDIRHYSVSRGHDDPLSAVRNKSGHTSQDLGMATHSSVEIFMQTIKVLLDPADSVVGVLGPST
jgi:hypothetical protein